MIEEKYVSVYDLKKAIGNELFMTDNVKCAFLKIVDGVPAADVEPVRHGKWCEENGNDSGYAWYCTACDQGGEFVCEMNLDDMKKILPRCPNCGAKMDKEENEND